MTMEPRANIEYLEDMIRLKDARIKELEARVAELELFVAQIAHRFVPKKMPLGLLRANCWSESSQARALLKEGDQ